jgi:DNA polymerase III gamma/tau subunit
LSTSERIDELISNLNNIHTQLDERIKRRTQQVSAETESVLAHIINETQDEQQRLLHYAKTQQTKQDEHYHELLQNYISQIDEMKAKELTQLQQELQECREQIMQLSQMKIMTVNEQANIIKSKIVKEEQQQASMKIDAVNVQLQNLSTDDTFQQLGSEIMTQTNVTTKVNAGTKAAGHNCSFELVKDISAENNNIDERTRQVHTKTTHSDIKSERLLNHEEVVTQIGKKVPSNPKLLVQEPR